MQRLARALTADEEAERQRGGGDKARLDHALLRGELQWQHGVGLFVRRGTRLAADQSYPRPGLTGPAHGLHQLGRLAGAADGDVRPPWTWAILRRHDALRGHAARLFVQRGCG